MDEFFPMLAIIALMTALVYLGVAVGEKNIKNDIYSTCLNENKEMSHAKIETFCKDFQKSVIGKSTS